jgi:quercetin dioxygenase-like cupin family protein
MKISTKTIVQTALAASLSIGVLAFATGAAAGECSADAHRADARSNGETEPVGVVDTELSAVDLKDEIKGMKDRRLRIRQLSVAPGGVVPWHSHVDRPALIMVVVGSITEYRSDCAEPIDHRAGEVSKEAGGISHWWKNNGDVTAILIAADIKHD